MVLVFAAVGKMGRDLCLLLTAEPKEASGDSDRLATGLQRREFNGQQERNTIKPNGQKGIEDAAVPKC